MPKITDPSLLKELNLSSAQGAPQGLIFSDPYKPREAQRADAALAVSQGNLANSQANTALAAQRLNMDAATLPAERARAEAEAEKARLAVEQARREQSAAPDPQVAKNLRGLGQDEILSALSKAGSEINGWSTGLPGQMLSGWWGTSANDLQGTLNTIGSALTLEKLGQMKAQSATGASGLGALSEREGAMLRDSVASIGQNQSPEKLRDSLSKIEMHYRRYRALLDGVNPDENPEAAQAYGIQTAAPPAQAQQLTASGDYQDRAGVKGANARVASMIAQGRPEAEIRGYLNSVQAGLGDQVTNLPEAIAWSRQNPGRPVGVDVEREWVPASGISRTLGEIGMSPLGAGVIGAADFLTAGTLDNFTGDPAKARAVMGGVQEMNPNAYLLGQVAGGVGSGLGLEAGLGRAGLGGLARMRVGDAALGASYAAGSADEEGDSRVAAALMGGATGLAGGALGRGVSRTAGRLVAGVRDNATRALNREGVPLTVGQALGGVAKTTEDRLAGLPVVGDAINARRTEGLEGFNRAAFDEALAPINATTGGQIGQGGINAVQDATSGAYDRALNGLVVQADAPFARDMLGAFQDANRLPQTVRDNARDTLSLRVGDNFAYGAGPNGQILPMMTGNDFQQSIRGLRGDAASFASQPYGADFAGVTRAAEGALEGMVARQSPDTLPAYQAANSAYRNQQVVQNAVLAALNNPRGGGVFTPTQLGQAARANTIKFGGRNAAARGDMPFNDLQQAAQSVLPAQIPDSGTAGRAVIPAVAAALAGGGGAAATDGTGAERAGAGLGTGAVAAALVAAPYSQAGRTALQRLLVNERPRDLVRVGDFLIDRSRIAGLLAAPAAVGAQQ